MPLARGYTALERDDGRNMSFLAANHLTPVPFPTLILTKTKIGVFGGYIVSEGGSLAKRGVTEEERCPSHQRSGDAHRVQHAAPETAQHPG